MSAAQKKFAKLSILSKPRQRVGPDEAINTKPVLGFDLVDANMAQMVYWIADRAQSRTPTQVAFLNAHCANIARKDWRYSDTLKNVDALLPDGSGVSIAAKLDGKHLTNNLNGTDLYAPLCRCLAFRNIPVFYLGGQKGVARQAAENTLRAIPNLNVAGHRHGFFTPREEEDVIEQINASGARVVFVAFGVPDQDVWIARIRHRLNAPIVLGVGGLLDFVSGRIPRAPEWMRKLGAEWLYRLKCEPRRMWKRYLVGNIAFLGHAVRYSLNRRWKSYVHGVDRFVSRCIDITASGLGMALLSPILLGTALAIRLESGGPVIFRQTRVGKNGKPFEMFKFRSMRTDGPSQEDLRKLADDRNDGITFKLKQDPRITKVGRVIRKYSIDELPQLWNVFKGDMGLVGPRPALPVEVEKYTQTERRRLRGKPGITCFWQIQGRADLPFDRQVVLDIQYLKTQTVFLDLWILIKTPIAVLTARGAY